MEEEQIIYPYFVCFDTEELALARINAINIELNPNWEGTGTDNYDTHKEDESGKFWVIVQPETERLFSIEELSTKKYHEEINWLSENINNP